MLLGSLLCLSRMTHKSYNLDTCQCIERRKDNYSSSSPVMTEIHPACHVILSIGRLEELDDRFRFNVNIV